VRQEIRKQKQIAFWMDHRKEGFGERTTGTYALIFRLLAYEEKQESPRDKKTISNPHQKHGAERQIRTQGEIVRLSIQSAPFRKKKDSSGRQKRQGPEGGGEGMKVIHAKPFDPIQSEYS